MQPPVLQTERLTLDAHRAEDLAALAAMWADPQVVRHIGGRPATRQDSWFRLLRYRGLWPLLGFGYWAVRERHGGRFAGDVGFADFKRAVEPSVDGVPEAGWVLAPWAQGKGFAHEALSAVLAWLDLEAWPRSVCLIDPGNAASLRLAANNGFERAGEVTASAGVTWLFERPRATPCGSAGTRGAVPQAPQISK